MDSRLIFLYPYICDVVTEKANRTQLLDSGRSKVPDRLANPSIVRGKCEGANGAILVVKSVMPALKKSC